MREKVKELTPGILFISGLTFLVASIIFVAVFFNKMAPFYEQGYTPTNYHDARVVNVYDAHNILVDAELGLDTRLYSVSIELADITTDGLSSIDGQRSVKYLEERLNDQNVVVRIEGKADYGRWKATLFKDGININDEMVKRGLAINNE